MKNTEATDCGWQSIETAPKDGSEFLGWTDEWQMGTMQVSSDGKGGYLSAWDGVALSIPPKLWHPLPAPPACNGTGKATACPPAAETPKDQLAEDFEAVRAFLDEGKPLPEGWTTETYPKPADGHGKREDR